MSAHKPHSSKPADGKAAGARPDVRYDPIAPALPLGRPVQVGPAEPPMASPDPLAPATAGKVSPTPTGPVGAPPHTARPIETVRGDAPAAALPPQGEDLARAVADLGDTDAGLPAVPLDLPDVVVDVPDVAGLEEALADLTGTDTEPSVRAPANVLVPALARADLGAAAAMVAMAGNGRGVPRADADLATIVAELADPYAALPPTATVPRRVNRADAAPDSRGPGTLPDADTDLPAAFADLPGTPAPSRPSRDEIRTAAAAALSWPPLAEELDAVEVIDLEAIRRSAPVHPQAQAPHAQAPSAPPAPATPTAGGPRPGLLNIPRERSTAERAPDRGALAWPPPPDEVDAIALIDLGPRGQGHDAAAVAPVELAAQARQAPEIVASESTSAPVPSRYGRLTLVGLVVTSLAAAGGYLAMGRYSTYGVAPEPAPGVATPAVPPPAPAAAPPGEDSRSSEAPPPGPSASRDSAAATVATPVPGANALADPLASSRRLLTQGDRLNAVRTALAAAPGPAVTQFVTGVVRGAADETERARASTLARVPDSAALDSFRAARQEQFRATAAWREGNFELALDLFGRAARAYRSVAAPAVAETTTPVGVTGRTLEVPSPAAGDRASAPASPGEAGMPPPLPTLPATTSGVPIGRETRPAPDFAPPAADARPVVVPRADEAGVRRTLEAYRSAFDSLDADAARAVVPSIDSRALARAFAGLESQRLEFERCDVDVVSDAAARATCVGRAASVPKVGSSRPRVDPRRWSFVLARQGDRWQITSAQVSQR